MTTLIQQAATATGPAYEAAEDALLRGSDPAVLGAQPRDPDPFVGLLLNTIQAWNGARPQAHVDALHYLDEIEARMARTAAGSPSPTGVANDLTLRFGDAVADLLALRLVKADHWPRWKTFGALLYLDQHKPRAATSALLRFAAETKDDEARNTAVATIRTTADAELAPKLAAEQRYQASRGRSAELRALWDEVKR
jgi:hypothetical protein